MILYIEKTVSTPKFLELTNESSKVAVMYINIQKFTVFLYINNELTESEFLKNHLKSYKK